MLYFFLVKLKRLKSNRKIGQKPYKNNRIKKDDDDESLVAQSDCSGSVRSRQSSEGPSTVFSKTHSWASSKSAVSYIIYLRFNFLFLYHLI